jgi:hypothetical protein
MMVISETLRLFYLIVKEKREILEISELGPHLRSCLVRIRQDFKPLQKIAHTILSWIIGKSHNSSR